MPALSDKDIEDIQTLYPILSLEHGTLEAQRLLAQQYQVSENIIFEQIATRIQRLERRQEFVLKDEMNRIISLSGAKPKTRVDSESSMLDAAERQAADEAFHRLQVHYKDKFEQMGGVDGVLANMETYLIEQLGGDPDARKRKENILNENAIALRALLDDAPGASFRSQLHRGAESMHRKQLAFYWLAASDPMMPIPQEVLDKEKITQEVAVASAKSLFISKVAEIRRAHNDGVYGAEDSPVDQPSCAPGTTGRIANSVLYNPLAAMPKNPLQDFPDSIMVMIRDTMRSLPDEHRQLCANFIMRQIMLESLYESSLERDDLDSAEKAKYDKERQAYMDFVDTLKLNKSSMMSDLTLQYEKRMAKTTFSTTRYRDIPRKQSDIDAELDAAAETAGQLIDVMIESVDYARVEDANPGDKLAAMVRVAAEQPMRDKLKDEIREIYEPQLIALYSQYEDHYKQLTARINSLNRSLKSQDISPEMEEAHREMEKELDRIFTEKIERENQLLQKAANEYKQKLSEKNLNYEDKEFILGTMTAWPSVVISHETLVSEREQLDSEIEAFNKIYTKLHLDKTQTLMSNILNNPAYRELIAERNKQCLNILEDFKEEMAEFKKTMSLTGNYDMDVLKSISQNYEQKYNLIWDELMKELETPCNEKGYHLTAQEKRLVKRALTGYPFLMKPSHDVKSSLDKPYSDLMELHRELENQKVLIPTLEESIQRYEQMLIDGL